ncbi:MAG: DUF192 domain-containing protein [Verrucomicrobia bacterium]|jgi:uncharacterized membrane protein (UPF0127 family)|nr:DUF192 domain-containing protein [Verrucomicrobiota bacterium]
MHPRGLFLFLSFPFLLIVAACQPDSSPPEPADFETWLPLRINEVDFKAQIALTPTEQRNGLMRRESLPADGGMLFPYQRPQRMSFWMANTPLPLDIGFFDAEGTLREIHRMVPFDRSRTTSSSDEIQFALEMNRGWFSANGLRPGGVMDLELLRAALRRRGADPAEFGL